MTNIPQAVTERYVSNLIHYGRNKEFDIMNITQNNNMVGDEVVGVYYSVLITSHEAGQQPHQRANAATLALAVRRALEKHGVTFR